MAAPGVLSSPPTHVTLDGNEAVASVAYRANEVIAIYPITPASPMGESSDAWAAAEKPNLWGTIPEVVEMQSEAGAAGAVHGALQVGALATTFTASQGLLLMIPNMFKIAGELLPCVLHVAARTVATHALSIFGDHSDVMAVRSCGWALLCSSSVQEAHDLALVAQAATLTTRVPYLHFFDGFRTSHEVNKIAALSDDDLHAMLDLAAIRAHRERGMDPERPVLRGSAQNPDVFFQAREGCNPYYDRVPALTQAAMDALAARTGRRYRLVEYVGAPDAERIVVLMGSGVGAAEEAVAALLARGEKVGLIKLRLFRPFPAAAFLDCVPRSVRRIAVLDRTKEPGAVGEPLWQDVIATLAEAQRAPMPLVIGGRYGLSSKEFTPAMVAAVFTELNAPRPKPRFTVGITDDVTHLSLRVDESFVTEDPAATRAVFFGLGSDGTVGANKNSVKIIGEGTALNAQGYFVYDSKKSGSTTVSHLRFGKAPIRSTYLIQRAGFVACHQFEFVRRTDVLEMAEPGATFLLNAPYGPDQVWDQLPVEMQQQILDKRLRVFVVDANAVAKAAGLGGRINTVMQACFFALSGVLPRDEAIARIKDSIRKSYDKRGESVLQRNFAAVDGALGALHQVPVPGAVRGTLRREPPVAPGATDFVQKVTALMIAGQGDRLPVSALPVDGTFPTGTAQWEKRSIATDIPIWQKDLCIECSLCALYCPHAAIRVKTYAPDALGGAPEGFVARKATSKEFAGRMLTIQVAPDDCTGCGVCVDVCPARSKEEAKKKAINMEPKLPHLARERRSWDWFLKIPETDRATAVTDTVKGSQLLEPLFEFSGACAGCGETPYLKLMSQLFGDRVLVANATGCSSIYGGNLPTTPWAQNAAGHGPAWANSLFEDNAEFGLGMLLAVESKRAHARALVRELAPDLGDALATELLNARHGSEADLRAQRERVALLRQKLAGRSDAKTQALLASADALVQRSVWIVGGDGWAYDIGFGGLDHVMASGRDVNILVLDTGVYSNTGGQASKATPRGAVAKFATSGRGTRRKDLGMIAMAYGNVYVAQVAIGANPLQTIRALHEAESYRGPSVILAYSTCIAHGIDMTTSMTHQKDIVGSAFWPLYRYDPRRAGQSGHPFQLDSRRTKATFQDFAMKEARFAMLARSDPEGAQRLFAQAQQDIDEQWQYYEQLAALTRHVHDSVTEVPV